MDNCLLIRLSIRLNTNHPPLKDSLLGLVQLAPALTMATARPITVMIPKDRSMVPTPAAPPDISGILVSLKLVVSGLREVVSVVDPSVAGSRSVSVVGWWLLNQLGVAGGLEFMLETVSALSTCPLTSGVRNVQGCSSHHCGDHGLSQVRNRRPLPPWVLGREE